MKTIHKLLLIATIALGLSFAACNNDDIPQGGDQKEGNTHVSVTLRLSQSGTRALPDDYNYIGEWGGNDVITNVSIYLVDGSSVNRSNFTVGSSTDQKDYIQDGLTLKPTAAAAIKTTAGQKKVYVVVNETSAVQSWLNKTPVHEFEEAYQNIALLLRKDTDADTKSAASELAKVTDQKDAIVMTNVEPVTLDVEANVSEEETITKTDKNRASLTVQRAVARVMVTIAGVEGGEYKVPNPVEGGPTSLGTLSGITWAVAQGENSLFVQQKEDFATPWYSWVPGVNQDDFNEQAGSKYDYSGLFVKQDGSTLGYNGVNVPTYSDYSSEVGDANAGTIGGKSILEGQFLLPTTHEFKAAPTQAENYDGGYRKGNTAYVLIRAKFTPAEGAWAGNGDKATDGTFYVGENGKFYTSAQAAYDDMGTTKMTKYEGGKVLYYAWLNPDQIPNWYNSPVLRNNIYHIHITGFKNLGTNWNPLYPEDPKYYDPSHPEYNPDDPKNIDKPKNPDPKPTPEDVTDPENPGKPITPEEPTNPIDPKDPLTTSETWMSVDVSILPWKVHSYKADLGI